MKSNFAVLQFTKITWKLELKLYLSNLYNVPPLLFLSSLILSYIIIYFFQLVKCYYNLEDYDNLENLVDSLQPDDKLLVAIGNMFATVGMGQQAVEAYTKVKIHILKSIYRKTTRPIFLGSKTPLDFRSLSFEFIDTLKWACTPIFAM